MGPLIRPFEGIAPQIEQPVFIAETAAVIGDVRIGRDSTIWYSVVLRGDDNFIQIGRRSNIQDGTVVHVNGAWDLDLPTIIGDDVTIGHNCTIHACTLHDRAFVGMGSTVLDGAVVESDAMIAANALVTAGKRVKAGEVWAGSPARLWREIRPEELELNRQIREHYCGIGKKFLADMPPLPGQAAAD